MIGDWRLGGPPFRWDIPNKIWRVGRYQPEAISLTMRCLQNNFRTFDSVYIPTYYWLITIVNEHDLLCKVCGNHYINHYVHWFKNNVRLSFKVNTWFKQDFIHPIVIRNDLYRSLDMSLSSLFTLLNHCMCMCSSVYMYTLVHVCM